MKSPLTRVHAAIVKVCPDVLELKMGCKIILDGDRHTVLYYDRGGKSFDGEHTEYYGQMLELHSDKNGEVCKYGHEDEDYEMPKLSELQILGRPITLADVLRAIDNCNSDNPPALTAEGQFCQYDPENGEMHLTGEYWNLKNDSLDAQSPETISFLEGVLGEISDEWEECLGVPGCPCHDKV